MQAFRPEIGPLRVKDVTPGGDWELSRGVAVECSPVKNRGGRAQGIGAAAIFSDPAVQNFGTEVGVVLSPNTLRAPDVSVLAGPVSKDWARQAPPLAIEYADVGQDETELRQKVEELLAAGTQQIWVVRLNGPLRVEVHRPGMGVRAVGLGDELEAPGVLANPMPVEALWDRDAARRHSLRNLLMDHGYRDLDEVMEAGLKVGLEQGLEQGREVGRAEGLEQTRAMLRRLLVGALVRPGPVDEAAIHRINAESDLTILERWLAALMAGETPEIVPR